MSIQPNENEQNLTDPNNQMSKNIDIELSNISNYIDRNQNLDLKKIIKYNDKCAEAILEDKIELPKEILSKLEVYLETNAIESKLNLDKKIIIVILQNLACCYQKIKDYDNCVSYLEAVIYHFDLSLTSKHHIIINEEYFIKSINENQSNYSLLGDFILELRFSAKFHLQMCAVLSQANRHLEALKHAKLATLMCEDNLIKTNYLYNQMNNNDITEIIKQNMKIIHEIYNRILELRNGKNNNIKNNHSNINNLMSNSNKNNFNSYLSYTNYEINKYQSNHILMTNIRHIFGNVVQKDDWIQMINIGNIMYLSPLNYEELELDSEPKYELLIDAILEKIVMLTVSYFCIANELRFLCNDKSNNKLNGEFYHYKAIEFSSFFLPVSCPIVKHYIFSYYKHYGNDMEIIPENEIIQMKIDLIRSEIEQDKDTLTFIRGKKINYIRKVIMNDDNNNILKRKNEQRTEIIPNNDFVYKSKIKEDRAPKFKLNINNLRDSNSSLKENNSDRIKIKQINNSNNNEKYSLLEKNGFSESKTERTRLSQKNNNKKHSKTNRYISANHSHNHTNNNTNNNSKGNGSMTARIGSYNKISNSKNSATKISKTQRDYFHSSERIFKGNQYTNNYKKVSNKQSKIQSSKQQSNKNKINNIKNNYNNNIIKSSNLLDRLLINSKMNQKKNGHETISNNQFLSTLIKVLQPKKNYTNTYSGNKYIKKIK